MDGIVLINKPANITSRDVINELNHIFQIKRIGHTGTLDPIATGVLVCPIGKYTKLVNELTSLDKEYIAEITLGIKTDTGDITGNVLEETKPVISIEEVQEVINNFPKTYIQTVPKYSAVKINGKKLYEYARNNIDIELPKREVHIYTLELLLFKDNIIKIRANVSKGTYIRSLIEDLCLQLKTIGTMSSLVRTKQGMFSIEDTSTMEEVKANNYTLLKVKDIYNYPVIELDEINYYKVSNGSKITNVFNIQNKVIFTYKNKDISIYIKEDNYLKPYIML